MLMMKREGQKIQKRYLLYGKWQEEVIGYWLLVIGGGWGIFVHVLAHRRENTKEAMLFGVSQKIKDKYIIIMQYFQKIFLG